MQPTNSHRAQAFQQLEDFNAARDAKDPQFVVPFRAVPQSRAREAEEYQKARTTRPEYEVVHVWCSGIHERFWPMMYAMLAKHRASCAAKGRAWDANMAYQLIKACQQKVGG